jgi:RNA polymerase sigma-70 factor (ECF subfamily)
LHDVLGVPFDEVATTLGRTTEGCRALASRAREHVREDKARGGMRREEMLRLRDAFADALLTDDPDRLTELLARDVVLVADGGGKKPAALNPIVGIDHVCAFLVGSQRKFGPTFDYRKAIVNGAPGFVGYQEGELDHITALHFVDGRIAAIYFVRNPDKLGSALSSRAPLSSRAESRDS